MPPVRAAFLLAALCAVGPVRAAVLRETAGLVQVRPAGGDAWRPAGKTPRPLGEGDGIRTGFNARARVELFGGSVLETAGNAHVAVEADGPGRTTVNALFGTLKLDAAAAGGRAVSVRAPVCLVRARGERVSVRVTVAGGGSATVEVLSGAAGVEDNRGGQLLLRAGQRVEVDLAGVHEATKAPTPVQARRIDFGSMMRRELALEAGREADFDAVSREVRRGERELGRVLVDSDGRRVRVEEFVVRPSAARLAVVTLNGRAGGLSFSSWDATFDSALPRDLAPVYAGLQGSAGAPTPWTLLSYVATRSNGVDALVERAEGGHQVDVNGNADPFDDVSAVFDPARDRWDAAPGAVFRTIFDRFGLYSDGTLKRGFTGTNLQTYADAVASSANDPITGAALPALLPVVVTNTSSDGSSARRTTYESYGDGTFVSREELSLSAAGGAVSRSAFGPAASGDAFRRSLLDWGYEQRLGASEFAGRTIRLVGSSRQFVVTGAQP